MSDDFSWDDDPYVCVGICRPDPVTRLCLGCGRPWDVEPVPREPDAATDPFAESVLPGAFD